MDSNQYRVTDNTNEMSFHDLFAQNTQVRIPLFQREYVWTQKQLDRLFREATVVADGEEPNRFLGAVIAVRRAANPAAPQPFEIVDGQQRLTTLFLFNLAAACVAARNGDTDYAVGLANTHFSISWWTGGPNTKLISSYADQGQLIECFRTLFKIGDFSNTIAPRISLPPATGPNDGKLLKQFQRIQKRLEKTVENSGFDYFKSLVSAVQTKLTFVFILLKDASNATTVFEGLNDPGIPIGIGDLVRNEVFSKVADEPQQAHHIHQNVWLPFRQKLGDHFDNYFFPFGVLQDSSTRQADLFKSLRELWQAADTPQEIIAHLEEYIEPYLALCDPSYGDYLGAEIKEHLEHLRGANLPSSTYPFLMKLLKEHEKQTVSIDDTLGCLAAVESFLVRRLIVGLEPTGLLAFFRTAWSAMDGKPNAESFAQALKKRGTIEWPSNERVLQSVQTRKIYKVNICNFLLTEYEKSLGGDVPASGSCVEHVLPQTLSNIWRYGDGTNEIFSQNDHDILVNTWGNLVLLSPELNSGLGNLDFDKKIARYKQDSMFKSARMLANEHSAWTPTAIRERSHKIGEWAIGRWITPS